MVKKNKLDIVFHLVRPRNWTVDVTTCITSGSEHKLNLLMCGAGKTGTLQRLRIDLTVIVNDYVISFVQRPFT